MKSRKMKALFSGVMVLLMLMLAGTVAFADGNVNPVELLAAAAGDEDASVPTDNGAASFDPYAPLFPPPEPTPPAPEPEPPTPEPEPEPEPIPEPEPEPLEDIDEGDVPLEGVEPPEEVPQTGDDSHILVYGTVGIIALAGIGVLEYTRRKKEDVK